MTAKWACISGAWCGARTFVSSVKVCEMKDGWTCWPVDSLVHWTLELKVVAASGDVGHLCLGRDFCMDTLGGTGSGKGGRANFGVGYLGAGKAPPFSASCLLPGSLTGAL